MAQGCFSAVLSSFLLIPSLKPHGLFFIMNVSVPNFYSVEVLHVGSVGDLLLPKYRIFLVLQLNQECREIAYLGYQAGSLSRSSSCASIRCSAQICQAILTWLARQPASSRKHLTVFVSKSAEVREGEHTQGNVSLCKATIYPKQPPSDGAGSSGSLVLSVAAVIYQQLLSDLLLAQQRLCNW